MEQIIYLIHSRASIGRTLGPDDPRNAVLMKIPLVPFLLREGRRPLSVEEPPWPAAAPPRVPPRWHKRGAQRYRRLQTPPAGTTIRSTTMRPSPPSPPQAWAPPPAFPSFLPSPVIFMGVEGKMGTFPPSRCPLPRPPPTRADWN